MKYKGRLKEKHYSYLNDESGLVQKPNADLIFFPETESEVVEIVKDANSRSIPISISGGGTGISGGRVPLEGWIVATDEMKVLASTWKIGKLFYWEDPEFQEKYQVRIIEDEDIAYLTVPVAMRLKSVQNLCKEIGWFYPPDPTERSAFIGGNIATNASGARSFKYGPTRKWVSALRVVLSSGDIITLARNDFLEHIKLLGCNENELTDCLDLRGSFAKEHDNLVYVTDDGVDYRVPVPPPYDLPKVTKNVAGLVLNEDSEPIDLFIGSNGTMGIITEATLRLIRPPPHIMSIFVFCNTMDQAFELIRFCQKQREAEEFPTPMSVEYLDERAVQIMRTEDTSIPPDCKLVIIEQDATDESIEDAVESWVGLFDRLQIENTSVATTYKEIENHKKLRHLVPETINSIVRRNGQAKLGTDYSIPNDHFQALLSKAQQIGDEFESFQQSRKELEQFGYAIWAHAGDSHIHLNFLPRDEEETIFAKSKMVEMMKFVVERGGSIAAEHGLGKKRFNDKPALYFQYGEKGVAYFTRVKTIMDSKWILSRGNLVDFTTKT